MLTLARVVILVLCWVAIVICGLRNAFVGGKMLDEVNARLPDAERFSPAWWCPGKYQRLLREYRRLHPLGKRLAQLRSVGFMMLLFFVIAILALDAGLAVAAFFGIGGSLVTWFTFRNNGPVPPPWQF